MNTTFKRILATGSIPALIGLAATALFLHAGEEAGAGEDTPPSTAARQSAEHQVHHRTVKIDGQTIFYREAGPREAPTVLLLHGFPTSSHMFRNLIPALSDRWHVVAPDYPGYGQSSMPGVDDFDYSFDHMAELVETFTERLGLDRYSLYLMDYGAPIGFRLAAKHPERVNSLIIQKNWGDWDKLRRGDNSGVEVQQAK